MEFSVLTFENELRDLIDLYVADGTITYREAIEAVEKQVQEMKAEVEG